MFGKIKDPRIHRPLSDLKAFRLIGIQSDAQSGQAVTEYLLILAAIVSFYIIIAKGLKDPRVSAALRKPFVNDFRLAYKNGHPHALSFEDTDDKGKTGPFMHPRAGRELDDSNFRVFFNPEAK